jgi:hypothetical protein
MYRNIFIGEVELGVTLVEAVLGLCQVAPAANVRSEIANLGKLIKWPKLLHKSLI